MKGDFFITKLFKSVFSFDYYKEVSKETIGQTIKYIVLFILLLASILSIVFTLTLRKNVLEIKTCLENEIGYFKLENNVLETENNNYTSIHNGDIVVYTGDEQMKNYGSILYFGKEELVVNVDGSVNTVKYSEIFDGISFDKNQVIDYLNKLDFKIWILIWFILFLAFIVSISISYFMELVLFWFVACMFAKTTIGEYSKQNMFKIAVYGMTLPELLNFGAQILETCYGFKIKLLAFLYFSIGLIYVLLGVLMNRPQNIEDDTQE